MDWQPISTAPKDGTEIILKGHYYECTNETEMEIIGHYDQGGYTEGWEDARGNWFVPTFWKNIPDPPKDGE